MATAWFITTYKQRPGRPYMRYCMMNDFTPQITADGGDWAETEVLGGYAIVKVRAAETTLATIAAAAGFVRVPVARLADRLSTLTAAQRTALANRLLAMGYTADDVSLLGNLRDRTLGDVLRFAASRRRKPRYDAEAEAIVLDGDIMACRPVDSVDAEIAE